MLKFYTPTYRQAGLGLPKFSKGPQETANNEILPA
jgi:hypothetical protein